MEPPTHVADIGLEAGPLQGAVTDPVATNQASNCSLGSNSRYSTPYDLFAPGPEHHAAGSQMRPVKECREKL